MKANYNDHKNITCNFFKHGRKFIQKNILAMLVLISSILVAGIPLIYCGTIDPLTPEERSWLNQHDGKIIVNNETGWPPIIDIDKDGNSYGIVMDYQRLVEKKLNFKFKMDKLDSWHNFMERFKKGEIHINNNLQKNPSRTKFALFTKAYINIPNAIIVRKEVKASLSLEKMSGMKIAVTQNFAIHDYIKNNYENLTLIPLDDDLHCLLETSTKGVDAAVVNLAVASFIIEKMGISNLRIAGYTGYTNELCFASRKDWPTLNQVLNKGLGLITQKERDDIYKKWISLGYLPFYKNRNFWIVICSISVIIFTFFFIILVWFRSLKRLVEQRTETLKKQTDELNAEMTGRKQVEKSLKKSEKKYRNIFENAVEGLFQSTPQGSFVNVNPAFARMLHYESPEDLVSSISDIAEQYYVDPEDRHRC
mgnify:FL=1